MPNEPSGRISMEDFRPRLLTGIVGQDVVVARLRGLADGVRSRRIVPPNLLFHGPPGIGKTTAARAFAREVLGDQFDNSFYQLRASDDRGVEMVRDGIIPLSRTPPKRGAPIRIFFFDEADALDPLVQSALRSAMEEGWGASHFIFACNDIAAISGPMRSRCTVLEFTLVPREAMRRLILGISDAASVRFDEAELDAIADAAHGVPREAVKLLVEAFARVPASGSSAATRQPDPPSDPA